jgi:basic amino acid/polyamine antiporter, APA family
MGAALAGNFDTLALISGGAICLVYGLVSVAAWRAQRRDLREHGTPFVLPGGFAIPLLAIVAMVLIVATLSAKEWSAIGIALAALVVVYVALQRLRLRRGEPAIR